MCCRCSSDKARSRIALEMRSRCSGVSGDPRGRPPRLLPTQTSFVVITGEYTYLVDEHRLSGTDLNTNEDLLILSKHSKGRSGIYSSHLCPDADGLSACWGSAGEGLIEAIARRVAELVRDPAPIGAGLVDAVQLARLLGVSRGFVYEHAEELGVHRCGSGTKPRLRFDPVTARRAFERSSGTTSTRPVPEMRREQPREPTPSRRAAVPLLPVKPRSV